MKYLTLALTTFFLLMFLTINVNAEVYIHGDITQDKLLQTTTERLVFTLDDIQPPPSAWEKTALFVTDAFVANADILFLRKNKPVDIQILAQVQGLPMPYSSGVVDYCNVSLSLYHNETVTKESYYFTATPATLTTIDKQLRLSDQMIVLATCHYTDSNMYENNILAGQLTAYVPAFQCDQCSGQSIESLENIVANENLQMQKDTEFYNFFQNIITYNYTFWLILSWLFKLGALFVGIMLIFAGAFFVYDLFRKLRSSI